MVPAPITALGPTTHPCTVHPSSTVARGMTTELMSFTPVPTLAPFPMTLRLTLHFSPRVTSAPTMHPGPMVLFDPMETEDSTKLSYLDGVRPARCPASAGADDATSREISTYAGAAVSARAQYASSAATNATHGRAAAANDSPPGARARPAAASPPSPKTARMNPSSSSAAERAAPAPTVAPAPAPTAAFDPAPDAASNCLRTSAGTTSSCSERMCGLASSSAVATATSSA